VLAHPTANLYPNLEVWQ